MWHNLDYPDLLPGSGILFCVIAGAESYAVEAQDLATTKQQVLGVLRSMFGADQVPEPVAFDHPCWSSTPWAYGS